jgi:chorismate dehydratase
LIFGSISYLNLLPFQIFFKKSISNSQVKQIVQYKKSVPSKINQEFKRQKIDAAFISSIKSHKRECTNLGIVSIKEVYSVFAKEGEYKKDIESDTSNALAKILNIDGSVIIGDKALKLYLDGNNALLRDLSLEWYNRYKLPFVFARLCYNRHGSKIKKLADRFAKKRTKIPQYYLKKAAKSKNISPSELKWYLENIYYNISYKEKKSLKLFLKLSKQKSR